MVWGGLAASTVAIFGIGIGIWMFSHRYMENWETLKREGKTHIWSEILTDRLSLLLCSLENETQISVELREVHDRAEEDESNMENDSKEYAGYVANELPYMPEIISHSADLREPLNNMNKLDSCYEDIPFHRKRIGQMLCAGSGSVFLLSLARLNGVTQWEPYIVILIVLIMVLGIGFHLKKHESKKSIVEEHGNRARREQV